jgi:hypothetical protein
MRTVWALMLALVLAAGCQFRPEAVAGGAADGSAGPDSPQSIDPDGSQQGSVDAQPGTPDAAPPDAAPPDAAPPDAAPPDAAPVEIGAPCPTGTECGQLPVCLDEGDGWTSDGFCTMFCTSDPECGPGAFCSPDLGGGVRICMPICAGGTCDPNRVCSTLFGGTVQLPQPACVSFFDCNGDSVCAANPFENPGGYCATIGCTLGDNTTCHGDGACYQGNGITFCLDQCGGAGDCRMNYDCISFWGFDVCLADHASPGDACANDAACGFSPWDCLTGASFPGGYCGGMCTPGVTACPAGSICHDPDGAVSGDEYCADTCTFNNQCRQSDGYQCRSSSVAGTDVCRL